MTHPTEEEMVDGFYSGLNGELQSHLNTCCECATVYQQIRETLDTASEAQVPHRDANYGAHVWARVSTQLPARSRRKFPFAFAWLTIPAAAACLALLFAVKPQPIKPPNLQIPAQVTKLIEPIPPTVKAVQRPARVRHKPSAPRPKSESEQDTNLLALSSLLETDQSKALPQLLHVIESNPSDRIREHALFVLAQSDSAQAHQSLINFARQSSDLSLQTRAVRMLGLTANQDEHKELTALYTNSSDQALKLEIINGLMFSGSKTALLKVAKTESDQALRNSAMADLSITVVPVQGSVISFKTDKKQILNSVFLSADSEVLLDVLHRQPNAGLRVATIRSLAVMGEQGKVLTNVYRSDNDDQVKRAVLDALVVQQNGDALAELARDETDSLRKTEILTRLTMIRTQAVAK